MKSLLFVLVFIVISVRVMGQEPYTVAPEHYGLDLTVDLNEKKLSGVCELRLTNVGAQPVDSISFLLYRLMKVTEVTDAKDAPLPYTQHVTEFRDFGKLQVNQVYVQKTLLPGETAWIKLRYNGYLLGYAETGMRYIKDRISPEFTLIRPDAYAYPYLCLPCFDVLRASAGREFGYTLTIHVPDSLVAVNGGELTGFVKEKGMATYAYQSKLPGWRIDIAVAPYQRIRGDWIDVFYFNREEAARQLADKGEACMDLYRRWWGGLQAYKGLSIIETEEGSGGQTEATTILLPSEAFNSDNGYEYLYHELSHLWNVPIREEKGLSPRWEEGLATFCQALTAEKSGDKPPGYAREKANDNIRRLQGQMARLPALKEIPFSEYGNQEMTGTSYTYGALFFATLYYWLGEEAFHKMIGGFYQQYYKSGAFTRTFTDYCIRHENNKRLQAFFEDWMYTANFTRYIVPESTIDDIIAVYKKQASSCFSENKSSN